MSTFKEEKYELAMKKIIAFNERNVYVGRSDKGYGHTYFAKKSFRPGDLIMQGFGKKIRHQTSHSSVQIDHDTHYLGRKWTGIYWNHSCNPNAYIKTRADGFPNLLALKKISPGSEIVYAYWMSEHKWSPGADEQIVKCMCGHNKCRGKIMSFSDLSKSEQIKLKKRKIISRHLQKRL